MKEQNIQAQGASKAAPRRPSMAVYTVVGNGGGLKSFWQRVGSCFINKDGSLKVLLNALPLTGELIIRDNEE